MITGQVNERYEATIPIEIEIPRDGEPRGVRTLVSEDQTLIGARLLAGYYLTAATIPGGRVTLAKLP